MNLHDKNDLKNILEEVYKSIETNDQQNELFLSIISDTELEEVDEEKRVAIISVKSIFYKTIIENNFKNLINKSFFDVLKRDYQVLFVLKKDYKKIIKELDEGQNFSLSTSSHDFKVNNIEDNYDNSLKAKLNFENYVVSNTNKMLHSAALSVSLNPGGPWNPLFIFGGSGLGKTHLLHAIGNNSLKNFSNYKVKYLASKDFGEMIHDAIKSKNTNENIENIKNKYLRYDMLLIDDIQFIQNWTKAKEIFFHIFNWFIENEKQVVITSDVYPQNLGNFEQRFITRFEKGLTMGVLPPDFEGAVEIIKLKLRTIHEFDLNFIEEKSIEYIANNFNSNVRELEGAINRVIFWTINSNEEHITYNLLLEIFKNQKTRRHKIEFENIIDVVSEYYNIGKVEIFGSNRTKNVLLARQIAIYLSRNILNMSLMDIGKKFEKNHSTIINSIKKIEREKEINNNLNVAINKIRGQILK